VLELCPVAKNHIYVMEVVMDPWHQVLLHGLDVILGIEPVHTLRNQIKGSPFPFGVTCTVVLKTFNWQATSVTVCPVSKRAQILMRFSL